MMCSDKVRYYRAGGMIYIFNLDKRSVLKFGFKPCHKRKRLKDPRLLHSSRHFYLLCISDFKMSDPSVCLGMCEPEWRELILGVSYL